MSREEVAESVLRRFVDTFTADDHPEVIALSGGEAMLRPRLVFDLATRARSVGCVTTALSGLFFANGNRIPRDIYRAIAALDHFSVSIDAFHEREVCRERVMTVIATLLADGIDLSVHTVAVAESDGYVDDLVEDLTQRFGQKIPVLVNSLGFFGRARHWMERDAITGTATADPEPCAMAAWPVIGFDGTIVACANDDALDALPDHLVLGHAKTDSWSTIRQRTLESSMMRAIRTVGPLSIAQGAGRTGCDGYCDTCVSLSKDSASQIYVESEMKKPILAIMEHQARFLQHQAGAVGFARRHGIPQYAELVERGLAS